MLDSWPIFGANLTRYHVVLQWAFQGLFLDWVWVILSRPQSLKIKLKIIRIGGSIKLILEVLGNTTPDPLRALITRSQPESQCEQFKIRRINHCHSNFIHRVHPMWNPLMCNIFWGICALPRVPNVQQSGKILTPNN